MKNLKNILTTVFALFLSAMFGQDKPTTTTTTTTTTVSTETNKPTIFIKKHEIKMDVIKLIAVPTLEASYEFVQSKNFSYGCNMLISFAKSEDYSESFSVTPFTRFYFQETKEYGAKGFFVEGFGRFASVYYDAQTVYQGTYYYYTKIDRKNYNQIAFGFCLGKKWINSSGFVFEFLGGVGRALNAPSDAPTIIGRFNLNVGYRF